MGKLTAQKIKNLTPGTKAQKFFDGEGLYLLLNKSGKYWRYKYRFHKKEKTLALGTYPTTSLKEARERHQEARKQLDTDVDPGLLKKIQKESNYQINKNTFSEMAWEWFSKQEWADSHRIKQRGRLENDVIPYLGRRPPKEITAKEILTVCKRVESRGAIDGAHRIKTICSQIFRYGIAKGDIDSDPCRDLRKALTSYTPKNMAAITNPVEVGELMRAIDGYKGSDITRTALRLAPLLFVRPGELRQAEWSEFDLKKAMWRIPAEKMKMKKKHLVPLSKQALACVKEIEPLTSHGKYLFPSVRTASRPMSDNTINAALRRMGYTKEEITGHGFRSTASTLLHEAGWDSNIVESQLAHKDENQVRGAYNHASYLLQRIKMMQDWADYLDKLKNES
ncbi:MAG: tyrosine-type recombinase/integrase [Desulfobacteraceae bacterium]|nr:tyrosine-type recombinase/integrase [Desulfobacteraceae bacterium]